VITFGAILDAEGRARAIGPSERVSRKDGSWLIGDVRLDGRRGKLACLQAYGKQGCSFVDHLAGDFSFALWDEARRRLICARDQLGVRPLFYAKARADRANDTWLVSNSLAWIAAQPGVDLALDDTWIADFLGVGHCLDFERTVYRHIHRLPPAHVLTLSATGGAVRRYWRLEIGDPIQHADPRLYTEQFTELLSRSIADRLPAGRVGISMSGGVDSSTMAACALAAAGDSARLVAETRVFDRLIPDDEERFSSLVARHLGIDLQLRPMDDQTYDPDWRSRPIRTAEPTIAIVNAHPELMIAQEMAAKASVWFHGEGPDNALLFEGRAYLAWLRGRGDWRPYARAMAQYVRGRSVGEWLRFAGKSAGFGKDSEIVEAPPAWLNPDLVRDGAKADQPPHPWHPDALASFGDPIWQAFFGGFDETPGFEWRHPYLDLRVLEFMLSVPPIPWARRKFLLREAMRDRLPAAILKRRKTPLARSPLRQAIAAHGLPALSGSDPLRRYVDENRLPAGLPAEDELDRVLRVHALDHWLNQEMHA
jgi:asparagine synthase (glutamine-hydrolysing)